MMNFRDEAVVPASAVLLREGQALHYEYDFGDGWEHQIVLEKITFVEPGKETLPRCIKAVLSLKKTAETRLEKKGWLTAYRDLLTTAFTRLSWASMDHYDGLDEIQYIAPFCFWLLSEKGDGWRPVDAYLNGMLKAFPRLPLAAYPVVYMSDEEQARSALRSRMLTLYQLLGLIEMDPEHARLRDEGAQVMRRTGLFEGMFVRL